MKNIPEWIVGGNESFGIPQKRKIGLFAGIGVGLIFAAVVVFFIARGKEKPSHLAVAPLVATPTAEPQVALNPTPVAMPQGMPKPTEGPPSAVKPVAETASAPVKNPAPAEKPAVVDRTIPTEKPAPAQKTPLPKPTLAEKSSEKLAQAGKPSTLVTKPFRVEKSAPTEKPVANPKPATNAVESTKAIAKPEANLTAKNNEEKLQKAVEAYQRGNTKLFQGNLVEAIADFKLAVRLNPKEPTPYRGLGLAFAQQGKTSEAISNLKRYLALAPKAADRALIEKRIQQLQ